MKGDTMKCHLSLLALLLLWPAQARQPEPTERPVRIAPAVVEGVYSFSGRDAAKEYGGAATLVRRDKCYVLRTTTGGLGIGIRRGDLLSVGWQGGQVCVFKVEEGRLVGEWANGDGQLYEETWTLLKGKEP